MYTKQEIEAAKQTARNLTGAIKVEIRTHNAMGIRCDQPEVWAVVKTTVKTPGYNGSYWDRIGTILELAAP